MIGKALKLIAGMDKANKGEEKKLWEILFHT